MTAVTMFACAGLAVAADDSLPPPAFELKREPHTGSNIRPRGLIGHGVPFNRRYDELTPDERNTVASWYEAMPDGDEPPFPADGLGPMYLALRKIAFGEREHGEWTFVVDVDAAGKATGVSIVRGEATEGTRKLATALMLMNYKPARCAGQPCAMSFPVRYGVHRRL